MDTYPLKKHFLCTHVSLHMLRKTATTTITTTNGLSTDEYMSKHAHGKRQHICSFVIIIIIIFFFVCVDVRVGARYRLKCPSRWSISSIQILVYADAVDASSRCVTVTVIDWRMLATSHHPIHVFASSLISW